MTESAPEETLALLTRLSQKPGVQSTLILSRESGAIVRTSGLISKSSSANPNSANPNNALPPSAADMDRYTNGRSESGLQSAEDVARLISAFVNAGGIMVDGLDQDDELRLLRVRTKKNELVIVPNAKYLLVVIHDTPPA